MKKIRVFISTFRELLFGFAPKAVIGSGVIFTVLAFLEFGFDIRAIVHGFLFSGVILIVLVFLCAGYALHTALIFRDGHRDLR